MTVYERIRSLGDWGINLRVDTPKSTRDLIVPYSHVVIWPGRVYPDRLADATLLSGALFTGVVLKPPGRGLTIGGPGLGYWLGDGDNKGSVLESAASQTSASLSTWVTALRPASLAAGTVTSPGGSLTGNYQWVTYRQALDGVCDAFGVEWRINPDFTLDVATATTLYGSTPVAIALEAGGGSDNTYIGLDAVIEADYDYSDYASKVYVQGPGGYGSSGGASSYRDGQGNLTTRVRIADSRDTPPGSEATVASNLVNIWSASNSQRDIKVTVNRFAVTRAVSAGEQVYLYDPEFGLQDTSNPVRHQGRTTFPLAVRVLGVRWPIASPMSVLLRYYSGGSYVYADLSDYVVYESGASTLEV